MASAGDITSLTTGGKTTLSIPTSKSTPGPLEYPTHTNTVSPSKHLREHTYLLTPKAIIPKTSLSTSWELYRGSTWARETCWNHTTRTSGTTWLTSGTMKVRIWTSSLRPSTHSTSERKDISGTGSCLALLPSGM